MSDDPGDRENTPREPQDDAEATLLAEAGEDLPTRAMPAPAPPGGRDPYQLAGTSVGHYEIQGRLGKGGMGVVYKAIDTRLHRTVALKFLLLSLSDEADARDRFFAEARSASALDHNNICTVHEFGETEDGKVYIVMGHYEGETLAEKMARSRLSSEAALDYGTQIASGLAAAHAKGILHRDMKPANVIVTKPAPGADRGIAKILDFGLAKIEGNDLTRSGTTMGTVAYMSPEQARGERVDHRSDIWSLGVMLYEMLTGERPFKGENDMAVLNALTSANPAPAPALDPELPAELGRVVLKCLQKDRDRRYDSVDQLLQDLRSFLAVGSQVLSSVYDPAAMARPRPRRWQAAAGAAGAVVVLLALALAVPASRAILLRPFSGAQAAPQRLVAVLPFINSLGPGPENQALADGLTFSLTGMVARLGTVQDSLWIVPASEIVRQSVTTAGDALKYFGVDTVLTGSVQQTGKTMEIVLYLIDPTRQPPRTLDSRTVAAPLSPSLTQRMVDELAQLLGVESDVRSRLSADAEGGTSAEVYTLYLQGLGFLQRYDQAGNLDKAISVFESALEGDAYYGPAHAGLCEALWQKFNQTDDVSLTTQAVASCESAAELAAGQASVLATVGRSYLEMGDNRRAEAELKRALELEPANADAYRWLGWAAFLAGRSAESEAAFRKAIELNPRLWLNHNDLGETLYQSGRFEEALSAFEESRRLTPENYLAYNALAVAHDELNHVDVALEHFRRSIELQPNPMAYRNLGYIRFREQRYDEAVDALEKARDLLAESPSFNDWPLWGSLASAYYWAGDQAAAEQTWERVIAVATPLYEVNPEDADVLVWLSDAHIALGDLERARFFQDRLLALALEANYVQYQIGRNYERLGDRKLAFSYIRRALEQRFDPRVVDRDPWLEDLRAAPEYQVLRQQYMPATG